MRKLIAFVTPLFAASVLSPVARAAVLTETFDYAPGGTLDGKTASNGNVWAIAGTATPSIVVTGAGLTAPSGLQPSGGNAVQFGNNGNVGSGSSDRVEVGNFVSGSVYYSLLLRVGDLTGANAGSSTTGTFAAGFNNVANAQSTNPTTVVARLVFRKDAADPTKFNLGTSVNSNDGTAAGPQRFGPDAYTVGDTLFVVARYTFNAGAGNDDVASLWVNADPSTFGAADAPAPTVASIPGIQADVGSIKSFLLRQNQNLPQSITADELRVDSTWAGVTPASVPEPAVGMGMLVVGATRLAARRRR